MTRVGLLEADMPSPPMLRHFSSFADMFYAYFSDQPDMQFISFKVFDMQVPANTSVCDAWIIPGSRRSVYNREKWTLRLEEFVCAAVDRGTPLLGICYGHQFIAQTFGAHVVKAENGRGVGIHPYPLTEAGNRYFLEER